MPKRALYRRHTQANSCGKEQRGMMMDKAQTVLRFINQVKKSGVLRTESSHHGAFKLGMTYLSFNYYYYYYYCFFRATPAA